MVAHTNPFRARVVLLGASNLTKAISTVIETAQNLLGSPLDVYCATGHGRSYGIKAYLFLRALPSILDARMWDVLREQDSDVPTYALITDVGNDVMYGPTPELIARWIDRCIERLKELDARIVLTSLPMERIEMLTPTQYLLARTLLFPTNRLTFEQSRSAATEVIDRLEQLAAKRDVPLVELPASWYGIDPIHIQREHWAEAWGTILRHWLDDETPGDGLPLARGSFRRWLRLRTLSPERWWLLNMPRGRPQPCATLDDGTRISLY